MKRCRRYSAYECELVRRLYEQGVPVRDIGARWTPSLTPQTTYDLLRRAGGAPKRAQRKPTTRAQEDIPPVVRAYLDHTGWWAVPDGEPVPTREELHATALEWWGAHDKARCKRCIAMSAHPSYPKVSAS